jgi:hypothetical protein
MCEMTPNATSGFGDTPALSDTLRRIEERIARIETYLGLPPAESSISATLPESETSASLSRQGQIREENSILELRFGEFGLSWGGSFIFFLGIAFLMTYTFSQGHELLASGIGYAASIGVCLFARLWKNSSAHFFRLLVTGSILLLYYTTMRLHFFAITPLVTHGYTAVFLLLLVVALQYLIALRWKSQFLVSLALVLGLVAAVLINSLHVTLPLITALALVSLILAARYIWWSMLNLSVALVYLAHLVWLVISVRAAGVGTSASLYQSSVVYLFLVAACLALPTISKKDVIPLKTSSIALIILNCFGFSVAASASALLLFQERMPEVFLALAGFFLFFSILQWVKIRQEFAPAIYACFGYLGLSLAIYRFFGTPAAFFWLALQSLLVVSMALWFRSKILVVLNSIIFVGILVAYWATAPSSNLANFSFAIVSLASARIMNWQKQRLTLRTEMLRNVYLAIAFVFVLYSLARALPAYYVALFWTAAALIYFVISLLLHNHKYRLMALFTLLATVFHLFLVDLAQLDPKFRVAAFLFLGVMALAISLFYSKLRRLLGKNGNESL